MLHRFFGRGMLPAILLLLVCTASALTLRKTSLEDLTTSSQLVVLGKVTDVKYVWEDASQRAINTLLTISVDEYIKGDGDGTVVVRQLGGQIGDFGDHVSGTPQFNENDEVVFFLLEHNGSYWIHSIVLGSYNVITQNDGMQYVLSDLRDINLVDDASRPVAAAEAYTWMPVNSFISEVRNFVQQ